NWLHECLGQILQAIHNNLASGNTLACWTEIISEPYRSRLQRRLKISEKSNPKRLSLGDKLNNYQTSIKKLTAPERNRILQAFNDQNNIALLLSGDCTCEAITDLPKSIHKPVKILFESAFELLTDLEIRNQHYKLIYDAASYHTCPFCGCEYFDAPDAPREALDHYLPEHKYPFAAANLRNLVPMGNKCNSRYKLAKDILKRDDGTRRKSFDPYNHGTITISLNNSQPFAGTIGKTGEPLPKWEIDFGSNSEEVTTWDDVFHIRQRYERDVLDEAFNSWLNGFRSWCRHPRRNIPNSDQELVDAIEGYAMYHESLGFEDRAFLKAAVFRMLHFHCQRGDQRLIKLITDVVTDVSV
ncbi:MAG TPA: hypothetical protein V6C85_33070, partial [Allocoleopsis sp.]